MEDILCPLLFTISHVQGSSHSRFSLKPSGTRDANRRTADCRVHNKRNA